MSDERRDPPPSPAGRGEPWYVGAFDEAYLERYAHRDDAEATRQVAWLAEASVVGDGLRVLDLCCGAGRHGAPARKVGARVVGLDLSAALLREACRRLPVARGDMRRLPFADAAFDGVFQMFTAFGYFEADDENRAVLDEVARVLLPGGRYALDLMNARREIERLVPRSTTRHDDGRVERATRSHDPARRRIEKEIEVTHPDGRIERRRESVRVFAEDELAGWLDAAGLSVDRIAGDDRGAPFRAEDSPRMIVVAVRR
ncbi:MAG: class I SAM-dependent methyltransferase [Planctomycetota bacterium JB042]